MVHFRGKSMTEKDYKNVKKELEKVIRNHKSTLSALKSEQDALFVQEELEKHFKEK